jgi:hypothetical protein
MLLKGEEEADQEVTWVFEEFKQEGEGERECWVGATQRSRRRMGRDWRSTLGIWLLRQQDRSSGRRVDLDDCFV